MRLCLLPSHSKNWMRIAVNTRVLLRGRLEGIGWFIHEVVRRLAKQHPECEFILLFDRPFDPSFVYSDNVKPAVIFPQARHPLLWWWWFEWSVPRALQRYKADVFLSPDGFCSLRAKTPTIMVTHDIAYVHMRRQIPAKFRLYYDFFVPRFLQRADRIVTVSEFSRQHIISHFPATASKISVAGNGIREGFAPLSEAEKTAVRHQYAGGQEYFFYIGSVHPRKNVHRLIEAFDAFKKTTHAPVRLLIGGRFAWQTGEVRAAYDTAHFKQDIVFLGYIPDEALPRLTGAALALAYVSLFEGFGVPLLEAMHCDVPVITSNVTALPEVAGDAALLVNPLEVFDIAKGLQVLYENADLRQHLVAQGRLRRERFSWDSAAEAVWSALLAARQNAYSHP